MRKFNRKKEDIIDDRDFESYYECMQAVKLDLLISLDVFIEEDTTHDEFLVLEKFLKNLRYRKKIKFFFLKILNF